MQLQQEVHIKLKLYPIMVFAATSLVCIVVSGTSLVSAQEVEVKVKETTIEATIPGEAIPEDATTIKDPTIEIEDLELLIKPLTVEELQHEAAGWLFLLKKQAEKISNEEIAIKRENRKIKIEYESIKALKDAEAQLKDAEKAQAKVKRTNTGQKVADNKIRQAKKALKEAEASLQDVKEAEAELKEDAIRQEFIGKAKQQRVISEVRTILKKATKVRRGVAIDSPRYQEITEKIDILEESINALNKMQRHLARAIPSSPKYKKTREKVAEAREAVKNATSELVKIMPGIVDDASLFSITSSAIAQDASEAETLAQKTEKIDQQFAQLSSDLENVEEHLDPDHGDESEDQKSLQQLEKIDQELQQHTKEEAQLKNLMVVNVTNLRSQQTAIVDRFNVVLDELDAKGGESISYRKYIDGTSAVKIDLTDIEGLGVRLVSWLKSNEGGILWGMNLAKFLGILLASAIAARLLANSTNRILTRVGGVSSLFRQFVVMVVERSTLIVGVLLALTSLGVSLGPVVALLGGASFVLAFALQSNLGNFASGLMLLVNKPFDVGDEIKVAGYWAYVDSISLANTKIKDFSGNIITLPNNTVWGGEITNYTHTDIRKVSLTIHVKFHQDIDLIHDMWMRITAAHPKVLDDPAPASFPWNTHYDYYIPIGLSARSKTEDYWSVYVDLLKELQKRILELNIELATPQQEIKLDQLLPESIATQIQQTNQLPGNEPKYAQTK